MQLEFIKIVIINNMHQLRTSFEKLALRFILMLITSVYFRQEKHINKDGRLL